MKKAIFSSFLLLLTLRAFSQSPDWCWGRQATGSIGQEGVGAASDKFGNVYAVGNFINTPMHVGSYTLQNAGSTDVFLVKYDTDGNVIWARGAGGSGHDYGMSVATDDSGNVFVTGYFSGPSLIFDTDTLVNTSLINLFIAKYSVNGDVLWAKNPAGTAVSYGMAVATDASGNVLLNGYFYNAPITFGAYTLNSTGGKDICTVAYAGDGTVLWAKSIGGSGDDYGEGVTTDVAGNVYITGNFESASLSVGSSTLTNAGMSDLLVVKYSSSGVPQWAHNAGGSNYDYGLGIATDAHGNVYAVGYYYSATVSFGSTVLTNHGGADMLVVKYDGQGTALAACEGGGTLEEKGFAIATDAQGVYVTGGFYSASAEFDADTLLFPAGAFEPLFFVKYDAGLHAVFARELTSGGDDWSGVAADGLGHQYVVGDFALDSMLVGPDTLRLISGEILFVAKFNCPGQTTGTELPAPAGAPSVYPNPFHTQTTVAFPFAHTDAEIKIIDVLGREWKAIRFSGATLTIDTRDIPPGIYFIQWMNEQGVVTTRKIIVE